MGQPFAVVHSADDPGLIVVTGEVDIYTAPELRGSLFSAIETAAAASTVAVTVELSSVSFIDARGLRVLVVAEAYACVRGVRILFTGFSPSARKLIRITGSSLSINDA
jgi:anti-sigma B factor antagonist